MAVGEHDCTTGRRWGALDCRIRERDLHDPRPDYPATVVQNAHNDDRACLRVLPRYDFLRRELFCTFVLPDFGIECYDGGCEAAAIVPRERIQCYHCWVGRLEDRQIQTGDARRVDLNGGRLWNYDYVG